MIIIRHLASTTDKDSNLEHAIDLNSDCLFFKF